MGLFDAGMGAVLSSIFSTVAKAGGQIAAGEANVVAAQRNQQAAQFQSAQLRQNAGQEVAAGQIAGENQDLNTDYVVSRALALAAASGGGASDPTIVNNIAKIRGEGRYRADVARYEGESKSRQMRTQADAYDFQGQNTVDDAKAAKKSSYMSSFATTLAGVAGTNTMAKKYGVSLDSFF
jgi:hypothetical protein